MFLFYPYFREIAMLGHAEIYNLLDYASELAKAVNARGDNSIAVTEVRRQSLKGIAEKLVDAIHPDADAGGRGKEFLGFLFEETCINRPELLVSLYPVFAMYCGNERHKLESGPKWSAPISWNLIKSV